MHANGCPWSEFTCSEAALGGHLKLLQWTRTNGFPWDRFTCTGAAKGGHLKLLQWERANGCPWDQRECAIVARRKRHYELMSWIKSEG